MAKSWRHGLTKCPGAGTEPFVSSRKVNSLTGAVLTCSSSCLSAVQIHSLPQTSLGQAVLQFGICGLSPFSIKIGICKFSSRFYAAILTKLFNSCCNTRWLCMVNLKGRHAVIALAILISCHEVGDRPKETFSCCSQEEGTRGKERHWLGKYKYKQIKPSF